MKVPIWAKQYLNSMDISFFSAIVLILLVGIFAKEYLWVAVLVGLSGYIIGVLEYFKS